MRGDAHLGVFMSWLSLFTLFMQVRRVLVNVAVLPLLVWTAWPVGLLMLLFMVMPASSKPA